ncbi:hypothetical protein AC579_3004 [Pseudocercospora musae]|uniref:Uncharacterized protein n=1 Tax=Pseudocercospora musae TaxID=113226 RepID=A0A139GY34_9PEZI|nr:hypothetical protein AC579_3004 [Pseudocercospora musae]
MDHFRPSRPQPAEEPDLKQILVCEKREEHSPSNILCSRNIFGKRLCSMARRRRSGSPSARRQAFDSRFVYGSTTKPEIWSTVVLAKDNAAHMQVLDSFSSKAQDHKSSTTTESKLLSAHPLVSGVSLNKKLAIAISVPICFFVLLAVVAIAIYCSKLHRPHRKDVSRRSLEHRREDAPQNTAVPQDQHRPAAFEEDGTQPDIKAILEALNSHKARSESDPRPFSHTQDESQRDEQPPEPSANFSTRRDSSSDDEGTHFSDLEDPFIDRSPATPGKISFLQEQEVAGDHGQTLDADAGHPPEPPPPLEELEDPFIHVGDDSITSPPRVAADHDHQARRRSELADDPGFWLKPIRKTDSAQGESGRKDQDEEVHDDRVIDHERTTLDSGERQPSIEEQGRQHDDSSEAWRLQSVEDPSRHSRLPSTVVDNNAYTTPKADGAEAVKGGDTYPNEPSATRAREAEDLDEQSEVDMLEQTSVDHVNDDLVSHIEAVPTANRVSPSEHRHNQSDRNTEQAVRDFALAPQYEPERDNMLLGHDLVKTARSRSFAGLGDDGEDDLLRRTVYTLLTFHTNPHPHPSRVPTPLQPRIAQTRHRFAISPAVPPGTIVSALTHCLNTALPWCSRAPWPRFSSFMHSSAHAARCIEYRSKRCEEDLVSLGAFPRSYSPYTLDGNQMADQWHKAWDGALISGTSILEASTSAATGGLGLLIDTSIAPTPSSSSRLPSIPTDLPSIRFETFISTTSVASPAPPISSTTPVSTAIGENSTQHVSSSSPSKSGPSSALYISLIVLSILILLTLLALAWFALRRRKKEKAELEEATQRYHAHGGSIDSSPMPPQTMDSFKDSLLTGPTVVDARTSDRTLVPDPSTSRTQWPLRSISRHKSNRILLPPAPPPKSEARSTWRMCAPPSSPTRAVARAGSNDAGLVGVHIPATHRIELSELSPVSPLSERDVLMRDKL